MRAALRKLHWYWKRGRVMSRGEWLYRLGRSFDLLLLNWQWRCHRGLCRPARYERSQFAFCRAHMPMLDVPLRFEPSDAEIDDLLAGSAPALSFAWRWRDDRDVWHCAPDSGLVWPRVFFGGIPYRPGNPVGDARVIWEP